MGIIGAFFKLISGSDDKNNKQPTLTVSFGMGAGGSLDQPCKPGRFYVYVHKDAAGKVFYVGKGTGGRAHSRDRPPEWEEYVAKKSGGKFTVEMLREGISEEDALVVEDAAMAQHGATIINRVNMHAPYDSTKMLAYCDAQKRYNSGLNSAEELAEAGNTDKAVVEFEAAYKAHFDVAKNSDYDLGARQGLEAAAFSFHPHALADRYTKTLAKAGRYGDLIAFAERYFREFGEPSNKTEEALKKRMEKARAKVFE
jgi:hypothetical protein